MHYLCKFLASLNLLQALLHGLVAPAHPCNNNTMKYSRKWCCVRGCVRIPRVGVYPSSYMLTHISTQKGYRGHSGPFHAIADNKSGCQAPKMTKNTKNRVAVHPCCKVCSLRELHTCNKCRCVGVHSVVCNKCNKPCNNA